MGNVRTWLRYCVVLVAAFGLAAGLGLALLGQQDKPKPKVSDQPLNAEQLAVYRGFFTSWFSDEPAQANLSVVTEPINENDMGYDKQCAALEDSEPAPRELHRFRPEDVSDLGPVKLRLIDADRGSAEVKENDPEKGMREGKTVDAAVENGFRHGLFSLSEIRFNRQHTRAAVTYSFVCGGLCGNGGTMVMARQADGKWKRVKSCGGWVS